MVIAAGPLQSPLYRATASAASYVRPTSRRLAFPRSARTGRLSGTFATRFNLVFPERESDSTNHSIWRYSSAETGVPKVWRAPSTAKFNVSRRSVGNSGQATIPGPNHETANLPSRQSMHIIPRFCRLASTPRFADLVLHFQVCLVNRMCNSASLPNGQMADLQICTHHYLLWQTEGPILMSRGGRTRSRARTWPLLELICIQSAVHFHVHLFQLVVPYVNPVCLLRSHFWVH